MNQDFKFRAYKHAMDFESVYNHYDEHYKVMDNPTVWRYMDFTKFKSLLEDRSVFFAKPSSFADPLEGSYSNWDVSELKENGELTTETSRDYMKKVQEFSAISCWHINEHESAGMWDLYLSSNANGVAVKTNYHNLMLSIDDLTYRIFAGKVQYIDFHKEMTSRNIYDTLFYKRKSFSHENELRLLAIASRIDGEGHERFLESNNVPVDEWDEKEQELEARSYKFTHPGGTMIPCNLNQLIGEVYVSPKSSPEFVEEIKTLVKKHGLSHKKVVQSDLYNDYVY
ncbi:MULTISPECIES: DUF2971 domain-containing protein [Priestia]|uniref:DUF2971 domain-containing protein n=1 Tax=Priestia megaterium (strain WSH-002) TaxID=1006007 RepID=A0A8D3WZF7_PRIMW|nr:MULTISPECIES: DUF2971 domain-containing protein [Priestia]AEN89692.1 hypothetical protein BMWSH_2810 [Priestia megaterium WSH-002]PHF77485.1 hypothetical protein COI42_03590 [Priestia aryabhattai]